MGPFGKAPLAAALSAALCLPPMAVADTLLFPNFDTRPGYLTYVTLVNKSSAEDLHWTYRYDDPNTGDNDCDRLAGFSDTEANDLMTFQVGNPPGSGPVPGLDTNSTGFLIGPGYSGYLMVYAYTGTYPGTASAEHTLFGEAAIANVTTGEIYKLRASNDPSAVSEANLDDLAYGATGGNTGTDQMPTAIWHATSVVPVQFNVLVADANMSSAASSPGVTIGLADVGGTPGNFYDVNGNLLGGAGTVDVRCFGSYTLSDLLPGAALTQAVAGGWAHVQITDSDIDTAGTQAPFSQDRGILVNKFETISALTGNLQSVATSLNRVDY
jgi:hypothetical protein